jgi:hypothetical protein
MWERVDWQHIPAAGGRRVYIRSAAPPRHHTVRVAIGDGVIGSSCGLPFIHVEGVAVVRRARNDGQGRVIDAWS